MKRVVVAALAVALLAGCGVPAGTDGSLVDDWAAPKKAEMPVPALGACHRDVTYRTKLGIASLLGHTSIDCAQQHLAETFFVGTFTGAAGARTSAPGERSPEVRAVYTECSSRAKEFLGDDYHMAFVEVFITVPNPAAWQGGARWYRCDLARLTRDFVDPSIEPGYGSLKGTLAPGGSSRADCFTITERSKTEVDTVPVACTTAHNGEMAGVYYAPDTPVPNGDKAVGTLGEHCGPVVAAYAGLPNDRTLLGRVLYLYRWQGEAEWARGNRAVQCYLWMKKPAAKLMKGAGPAAFPVS